MESGTAYIYWQETQNVTLCNAGILDWHAKGGH